MNGGSIVMQNGIQEKYHLRFDCTNGMVNKKKEQQLATPFRI